MLSTGKFSTSLNGAHAALRDLGLFSVANSNVEYPRDMAADMRKLSYREQWARCRSEGWFDYQLFDGALLQFRRYDSSLSYSFLEAPFSVLTFEEFAYEKVGEDWRVVEDDLHEEYEFYLSADLAEKSVTPVRYDYQPDLYRPGAHPAGHLHFGVDNQVRICVRRILTPVSFILFVARQFYPLLWENWLARSTSSLILREVRVNLMDVPSKYFTERDLCELWMQ